MTGKSTSKKADEQDGGGKQDGGIRRRGARSCVERWNLGC